MNLLSLGTLLLIWIGLSIAERFQQKQLMMKAQEQEASENGPETDGADRFMIQQIWKLLDRATGILSVLGIPIVLSVVMGHKIFLDSSLLDILIVLVGTAVVVAILFRDRLWRRPQAQENESALRNQHARHGHDHDGVGVTNPRTDSEKNEFLRQCRTA